MAVSTEQVVAGVGVTVEQAQLVEAPEGEAVERLGGQVALGPVPGHHLVEPGTDRQLCREHPARRQVVDHRRDVDGGVVLVVPGELALVGRLVEVVELLDQPGPQLLHHRRCGRGHGRSGPCPRTTGRRWPDPRPWPPPRPGTGPSPPPPGRRGSGRGEPGRWRRRRWEPGPTRRRGARGRGRARLGSPRRPEPGSWAGRRPAGRPRRRAPVRGAPGPGSWPSGPASSGRPSSDPSVSATCSAVRSSKAVSRAWRRSASANSRRARCDA